MVSKNLQVCFFGELNVCISMETRIVKTIVSFKCDSVYLWYLPQMQIQIAVTDQFNTWNSNDRYTQ